MCTSSGKKGSIDQRISYIGYTLLVNYHSQPIVGIHPEVREALDNDDFDLECIIYYQKILPKDRCYIYNNMYNVFSFVQDKCPFCLKRNHGHIFLKGMLWQHCSRQLMYCRSFKQGCSSRKLKWSVLTQLQTSKPVSYDSGFVMKRYGGISTAFDFYDSAL